jgi:hypothetical protein
MSVDALAGVELNQLVDAVVEKIASKVADLLAAQTRDAHCDDDSLLSYQQVADLLTARQPPPPAHVKHPTAEYVAILVRRGELPCVRYGKYRRVRWGDYRSWVARHWAEQL